MKNYGRHALVSLAALALLLGAVALLTRTGEGQARAQETAAQETLKASGETDGPSLKPTAVVRERRAVNSPSNAASSAVFRAAATRNRSLRSEVGWSLYVPLIGQLIGTDAGPHTEEFAESLARWQTSAGLAPSGVLDSRTLSAMFATWQAARPKGAAYPRPDQLVQAPRTDFYDPSRADELRMVEREAYAAYRRMVAAAAADPSLGLRITPDGELAHEEKFLKIISSFRSREYQDRLRKQSPNAGRAALAVNSPHFTGRALDIYVGGEPVSTKEANRAIQVETPVYKWLVKNAGRFGFRPYYYEPWHWEYRP